MGFRLCGPRLRDFRVPCETGLWVYDGVCDCGFKVGVSRARTDQGHPPKLASSQEHEAQTLDLHPSQKEFGTIPWSPKTWLCFSMLSMQILMRSSCHSGASGVAFEGSKIPELKSSQRLQFMPNLCHTPQTMTSRRFQQQSNNLKHMFAEFCIYRESQVDVAWSHHSVSANSWPTKARGRL